MAVGYSWVYQVASLAVFLQGIAAVFDRENELMSEGHTLDKTWLFITYGGWSSPWYNDKNIAAVKKNPIHAFQFQPNKSVTSSKERCARSSEKQVNVVTRRSACIICKRTQKLSLVFWLSVTECTRCRQNAEKWEKWSFTNTFHPINSLVSIRSEKVTLSEPPFQNKRTGSLVKDLINKEQIRWKQARLIPR